MAKKKAKRHTPKRRTGVRRMGAVHSDHGTVMELVGLVVASVAGTVAQKQLSSMNPKIVSGIELAGGVYLKRHGNSPFMQGLAYGLMGTGIIGLTHEFGLIRGLDDLVSGINDDGMNGFENQRYVAGIRNDQHIAAVETEDMPPMKQRSMAELFHAEGLNG